MAKATFFDDALFGVTSPGDEEIASCANNTATQMLPPMEAGQF
jgi:hypothetical protein